MGIKRHLSLYVSVILAGKCSNIPWFCPGYELCKSSLHFSLCVPIRPSSCKEVLTCEGKVEEQDRHVNVPYMDPVPENVSRSVVKASLFLHH